MMVNYGVLWLVVDLPLWKMMEFVSWNYWNIWKNKIHVPKHQPGLMRGLFDSPPAMSNRGENPWTKWRFQWEIVNSWFVKLPCLIKKVAIYVWNIFTKNFRVRHATCLLVYQVLWMSIGPSLAHHREFPGRIFLTSHVLPFLRLAHLHIWV